MKNYFVDFVGGCEIKANSPEEALDIFWKCINEEKPLPSNQYFDVTVEEKE